MENIKIYKPLTPEELMKVLLEIPIPKPRTMTMMTGCLGMLVFDFAMVGINDMEILPKHFISTFKRTNLIMFSLYQKHGNWKIIVDKKEANKIQVRYGTKVIGNFANFSQALNKIKEYGK